MTNLGFLPSAHSVVGTYLELVKPLSIDQVIEGRGHLSHPELFRCLLVGCMPDCEL
jgi:hypothetical protein